MRYMIGRGVAIGDMSKLRVGDVIVDRDISVEFELINDVTDHLLLDAKPTFEVRVIHSDNSKYSAARILLWNGTKFIGESKTLGERLMSRVSIKEGVEYSQHSGSETDVDVKFNGELLGTIRKVADPEGWQFFPTGSDKGDKVFVRIEGAKLDIELKYGRT